MLKRGLTILLLMLGFLFLVNYVRATIVYDVDSGSDGGSCLSYCVNSTTSQLKYFDNTTCKTLSRIGCKYGCDPATGYCKSSLATSAAEATSSPVWSCTDSDGGIVSSVKGSTTTTYLPSNYTYSETDRCQSTFLVNESYCGSWSGNSRGSYISVECSSGLRCQDGACVKVPGKKFFQASPDGDNSHTILLVLSIITVLLLLWLLLFKKK